MFHHQLQLAKPEWSTLACSDRELSRKTLAEEQETPGRLTFLKEQQWSLEFGTALVAEQSVRASVRVSARLEARPGGAATGIQHVHDGDFWDDFEAGRFRLVTSFQTLQDDTEVFYQMSDYADATLAAGVRWNDPAFGIRWPLADVTIGAGNASYQRTTLDLNQPLAEHAQAASSRQPAASGAEIQAG